MVTAPREDAPVPRPGGQDALVLTRSRLAGGSTPEFLSVTMLPGRGMNVLQITAYIPDKGEVGLLVAPSLEQAAAVMTGTGEDANSAESLKMGAPFEAPWAGRIWGGSSGGHVTVMWRGERISLPEIGPESGAVGGLLLGMQAEANTSIAMPDGGQGDGTFAAGDFGVHWPSKTEVKTSVLLTGRSIELIMTAHNSGQVPEPIGLGWRPRFLFFGDRNQVRLRTPGMQRLVKERDSGLPTGQILPVAGTPYDFTAQNGAKLDTNDLNETFVDLHRDFLENGPITEMRDPTDNYGLRLTTITGTIRALHVESPAGAKWIMLEPRYNYDDPFGHEWAGKDTENGMVILQPGQTTQWEVRLEVFALTGEPSPF